MPEKLETAELAVDTTNGNLYTKLDDGSVVHLNDAGEGGDGTGSSVHIGEAPPAGPQEGQQWMEVPADGDAIMWIYDGDKWLQQPGGKDGADGVDGKDGVDGLWTDNGDTTISYNAGNVYIDADGVTQGGDAPLKVYSDSGSQLVLAKNGGGAGISLGSKDTTYGVVEASAGGGLSFWTGDGSLSQAMTIDVGGKVEVANGFSGSISALGMFRKNVGGVYFADSNVLPASADGTPVHDVISLGSNDNRFKNCYLTGSVVSTRSGVLIGSRDIIETLATLRNATKDEETLEGLRDAIGNAVGGLIEKFEAMQSTATQEIEQ